MVSFTSTFDSTLYTTVYILNLILVSHIEFKDYVWAIKLRQLCQRRVLLYFALRWWEGPCEGAVAVLKMIANANCMLMKGSNCHFRYTKGSF